jgi:8-oxo-dGTP pyrophosphatase MutT (NUDIX family)
LMDPSGRDEPESSTLAFSGPLFRVEIQTWPGGVRRDVVRHPGACGAVVFVDESHVLLVRQLREAVGRRLLEIPAGIYDVGGEGPEAAVRREIWEETGYRTTKVSPLGSILTSPGFSDERIDLFAAEAGPDGEPEAGIEVVIMGFDEAVRAVRAGEIEDAKTMVALLLAGILTPGPIQEGSPT